MTCACAIGGLGFDMLGSELRVYHVGCIVSGI